MLPGPRCGLHGHRALGYNVRIVTCVESSSMAQHGSAARRRIARLGGVLLSTLVVTGMTIPVLASSRPAFGDQLADDQAQAAALTQEIAAEGEQINVLAERYDAAELQLQGVQAQVSSARAAFDQAEGQVSHDRGALRSAAINAYVDAGSDSSLVAIFDSSQQSYGLRQEYTSLAAGDLTTSVSRLQTAEQNLQAKQQQLDAAEQSAQDAVDQAAGDKAAAEREAAGEEATLANVKGKVATLVAQMQAAKAAAAARSFRQQVTQQQAAPSSQSLAPPPPPAAGGAGAVAVAAAESQLGVPYEWGASDPGVAFDCSGLTMWAWGQAGVSLPHYSGAQMADSTIVPLADIEPGDLLFYGPGGSEHVAMYIGGGEMVEAPYTGAVVWNTGVRTDGLAGVGRP